MANEFIPVNQLDNPVIREQYKAQIAQGLIDTPENPDVYIVWAVILFHEGNYDEAIRYAKLGIGFDPTHAGHYTTLATILDRIGRREESYEVLRHAYSLSQLVPAVNWNLGLACLARGDFETGYDLYRWRKIHMPGHTRTLQPDWEKQKTIKEGSTLLIWCEQGLGDIVMNFRYIKEIKKKFKFGRVVLECPDELYTLFARHTEGIDDVYVRKHDFSIPVQFDQHCSIMDLPFNLGIKHKGDIKSEPYLTVNNDVYEGWEERFKQDKLAGGRIGINWCGQPKHPNDKNRSAFLADFLPLQKLGNLFAFQKNGGDTERFKKPEEMTLYDVSGGFVNADFTSGVLKTMDCLVTVDTFIAHLAGALGIKTYLLLPFNSEWRWLTGEGQAMLYDSITMIKQQKEGDWSYPINEACRLIKEG